MAVLASGASLDIASAPLSCSTAHLHTHACSVRDRQIADAHKDEDILLHGSKTAPALFAEMKHWRCMFNVMSQVTQLIETLHCSLQQGGVLVQRDEKSAPPASIFWGSFLLAAVPVIILIIADHITIAILRCSSGTARTGPLGSQERLLQVCCVRPQTLLIQPLHGGCHLKAYCILLTPMLPTL